MYTIKSENVFVEDKRPKRNYWKEFCGKLKTFYMENKHEFFMAIMVASTIVRPICRMIQSVFGIAKKENLMRNSVYDRSEGHHWLLRRTPTNAEWYEVNNRRKNGERLGDILESMRLLK